MYVAMRSLRRCNGQHRLRIDPPWLKRSQPIDIPFGVNDTIIGLNSGARFTILGVGVFKYRVMRQIDGGETFIYKSEINNYRRG